MIIMIIEQNEDITYEQFEKLKAELKDDLILESCNHKTILLIEAFDFIYKFCEKNQVEIAFNIAYDLILQTALEISTKKR